MSGKRILSSTKNIIFSVSNRCTMSGKVEGAQKEAVAVGKHLKEATAAKAEELKDSVQYAVKEIKRSAEKTACDLKAATKDAKDSAVHKSEDVKAAVDRKLK